MRFVCVFPRQVPLCQRLNLSIKAFVTVNITIQSGQDVMIGPCDDRGPQSREDRKRCHTSKARGMMNHRWKVIANNVGLKKVYALVYRMTSCYIVFWNCLTKSNRATCIVLILTFGSNITVITLSHFHAGRPSNDASIIRQFHRRYVYIWFARGKTIIL